MINRLLLPIIILAALAGLWVVSSRAQTIGCSNTIFGKLDLITRAEAQTIIVPCNSGPPPTPGDLLLEDNSSFLLLEDGTSKLCLEAGC